MQKVKPKLTEKQIDSASEAMNVIYLCTQIIDMAWMINMDLKFANPNLNNFNRKISDCSLSIRKSLHCIAKDENGAQDRAIELYRAINNLSQYNTEDLQKFNDLTESEILKINNQ